jgi:hypothetical protein
MADSAAAPTEYTYAAFDTAPPTDDVLAELTTPDAVDQTPGLNISLIRQLAQLRAKKKIYEEQAKALNGPIDELNRRVVEHIAEATDADLRAKWNMTVDGDTAYSKVVDYPAYLKIDPDAEDKYGSAHLVDVAARSANPELFGLVKRAINGNQWNALVNGWVAAWRSRCDETGGPTDEQGRPLDHWGNLLTAEEAEDPTAPELALPPEVRAIVGISTKTDILFRRK